MAAKPSLHPPVDQRERAEQRLQRRQAQLEQLRQLDRLRDVPPIELGRVVDHCTLRAFTAGATVMTYQRHARHLLLVEHGELELRLQTRDGGEVLVGVLGRGDCCGESMLFGDLLRSLGAFALTNCRLIQIPLSELRSILPTTPTLALTLRQIYTRRLVESTLARVPLLSRLSSLERAELADHTQPVHYARGNLIIEEGQIGSALHIIEAGQVLIEQHDGPVATLKEGSFFGEISLLRNVPHSSSVRALTPTDILRLPGSHFHHLLDQRPELDSVIRSTIEARLRHNRGYHEGANDRRELTLAVNRGILRGSHLLVRSPELCPPECRICETACRERFGRARLRLNGTAIETFDVLDGCRQCSVGAECVEACPVDAFEWTERGALMITDRCTGCGKCLEACPYDAVGVQPLVPTTGNIFGQWWAKLRERQKPRHGTIPLQAVQRADKCDLCVGHSELACISQCPTGSLKLLPVEEIFPF